MEKGWYDPDLEVFVDVFYMFGSAVADREFDYYIIVFCGPETGGNGVNQ